MCLWTGADIQSASDLALSAIDLIAAIDPSELAGEELQRTVLSTERLLNAVNALSALLLERFEQEGGWALDGALSAAAWTAERTGSARAGLRSRRRQGAALARLPGVAHHARGGRLSPDHLRAVGECAHRHPDLAADADTFWVAQAEALGAEAFRLAARHWLSAADDRAKPDPADCPPAPEPVSYLHASRTLDAWLRLDGLLAPGDADVLAAALDAGVDRAQRAARDGDPSAEGKPASELRAGVLVDLAAQSMRREPSDASVPDRYRVAVVVRAGEDVVPGEAVCDAIAFRVALGAAGELLDVGRQTQRWPAAIRRAITIRDGGCVFPGCDRPPSWTDVHHCTPLGRRRRDLSGERCPRLPAPPRLHPPTTMAGRHGGRPARHPTPGRHRLQTRPLAAARPARGVTPGSPVGSALPGCARSP